MLESQSLAERTFRVPTWHWHRHMVQKGIHPVRRSHTHKHLHRIHSTTLETTDEPQTPFSGLAVDVCVCVYCSLDDSADRLDTEGQCTSMILHHKSSRSDSKRVGLVACAGDSCNPDALEGCNL